MAKQQREMTAKQKKDLPVKKGSGNVFADLGLPDAEDLQIKAELTRQIYSRIKSFGLTQAQTAKRLGLQQPDVSKLMNGRYTGFSTERLMSLLTALKIDIEIVLRPRGSSQKSRGTVRVLAEVA
jgi:predicted XRE-type DNA-binding protein